MRDFFFGDIHFSSMNKWNAEAGEKFISWSQTEFSNDDYSDSRAWFLGDLAHKDQNPGDVIDQLYRLIKFFSERFYKVYLLMGNHDLKLYRGSLQHSLKFLGNLKNVVILDKDQRLEFDNKTVLALPHQRIEGSTIENYYSTCGLKEKYKQSDLAIGHWMVEAHGVPLDKIPADHLICGHVHTRSERYYIGSIWPCSITEEETRYPRCYIEWTDSKKYIEHPLPKFLTYKEVQYPDAIEPSSEDVVEVYTVTGLNNLTEAKSFYKDHYIRGVNRLKKLESEDTQKTEFKVFDNNIDALNAMIKETKLPVSRRAFGILSKLLS